MFRHFRRFTALTTAQKWLLAEAVLFLFSAKLLLLILPFKNVMKFSISKKSTDRIINHGILNEIKKALYSADKLSFWKNRCLVQSIAGRWMLQRRGIPSKISFGVDLDDNRKLIAHAWLTAGNFELVEKKGDYQELKWY